MAMAHGYRVAYAAEAGHVPAEAEIERARQLITETAQPPREAVPGA